MSAHKGPPVHLPTERPNIGRAFAAAGLWWTSFAEVGHAGTNDLVAPAVFGGLAGGVERRTLPPRVVATGAPQLNARVPPALTQRVSTGNHNRIAEALGVGPTQWRSIAFEGPSEHPSAVSYTVDEPEPPAGVQAPRQWRVALQIDGRGRNQQVSYCSVTESGSDIAVQAGSPRGTPALDARPSLGNEAVQWLCRSPEQGGAGIERGVAQWVARCMTERDPPEDFTVVLTNQGLYEMTWSGPLPATVDERQPQWSVRLHMVPSQGSWEVGAVQFTPPQGGGARRVLNNTLDDNPLAERARGHGFLATSSTTSKRSADERSLTSDEVERPPEQRLRVESPVLDEATSSAAALTLDDAGRGIEGAFLSQADYRWLLGPGNEGAPVCWAIAIGVAIGQPLAPEIAQQAGLPTDQLLDGKQTLALLQHLDLGVMHHIALQPTGDNANTVRDALALALEGEQAHDRAVLLYCGPDGKSAHHVSLYRDDDGVLLMHDGVPSRQPWPVTLDEVVQGTFGQGPEGGKELQIFAFDIPEGGMANRQRLQDAWNAFAAAARARETAQAVVATSQPGSATSPTSQTGQATGGGNVPNIEGPSPQHGRFIIDAAGLSGRWQRNPGRRLEFDADNVFAAWYRNNFAYGDRMIQHDAAERCGQAAADREILPRCRSAWANVWEFPDVTFHGTACTFLLAFADVECHHVVDIRRVPGGDVSNGAQLANMTLFFTPLPWGMNNSVLTTAWSNAERKRACGHPDRSPYVEWRKQNASRSEHQFLGEVLHQCAQQLSNGRPVDIDEHNPRVAQFTVSLAGVDSMWKLTFLDGECRRLGKKIDCLGVVQSQPAPPMLER